jgi:5-formyltetrahydrofolate cyclo-ligase
METTKSHLRKTALTNRKNLSPEAVEEKSQQICRQFLNAFQVNKFTAIHIFLPIAHQNEINTFLLIEQIQLSNPKCKILVPKVINETNEMVALVLEPGTVLNTNSMGIPEPENAPIFDPKKIDLIIMPLVAVDTKGNRIGYGKGFYDKFLGHCKPDILKVGLSFDEPVNVIQDIESHDKPLDFLVCPDKVYKF